MAEGRYPPRTIRSFGETPFHYPQTPPFCRFCVFYLLRSVTDVLYRLRNHRRRAFLPCGISRGQNRVSIDRLYYPQCSHSDYEYRNKSGHDGPQHQGAGTPLSISPFLVMITAIESETKGIQTNFSRDRKSPQSLASWAYPSNRERYRNTWV